MFSKNFIDFPEAIFLRTNEKQTFKITDEISAIMIEPEYNFTTIYLNIVTGEFELTVR